MYFKMIILQQNFMPLQSDINTNKNSMALFYKFTAKTFTTRFQIEIPNCFHLAAVTNIDLIALNFLFCSDKRRMTTAPFHFMHRSWKWK